MVHLTPSVVVPFWAPLRPKLLLLLCYILIIMIELICFDPLDFSSVTLIIHLFPNLTKAFIHFLRFLCIQFDEWIYFFWKFRQNIEKIRDNILVRMRIQI